MLIVIPTYKRNACLKWVLKSLIQCRTENITEPIRVVVVNNYPPARDEIRTIVCEFSRDKRFLWDVLYRESTLPPIENWYSAIFELALPDEVVLLHGDDDLFLPWSIEKKFAEACRLNVDLLLSQIGLGLFFGEQTRKVLYTSSLPSESKSCAEILNIGQVYDYAPQHVSNHCYRNTKSFKSGYAKAMSWCNAQDWVKYILRTANFPLYMSYAILLSGGRVGGLRSKCIIRGSDAEENRQLKYGTHEENHGFMHLLALGVLNNSELKEFSQLDSVRSAYTDPFIAWAITYLCDSRVGYTMLFETLRKLEFPVSRLFSYKAIHGFKLLFAELFGLRGVRLRRQMRYNSIPTETFMERLAALSSL